MAFQQASANATSKRPLTLSYISEKVVLYLTGSSEPVRELMLQFC
jgi:hypothetical protein